MHLIINLHTLTLKFLFEKNPVYLHYLEGHSHIGIETRSFFFQIPLSQNVLRIEKGRGLICFTGMVFREKRSATVVGKVKKETHPTSGLQPPLTRIDDCPSLAINLRIIWGRCSSKGRPRRECLLDLVHPRLVDYTHPIFATFVGLCLNRLDLDADRIKQIEPLEIQAFPFDFLLVWCNQVVWRS